MIADKIIIAADFNTMECADMTCENNVRRRADACTRDGELVPPFVNSGHEDNQPSRFAKQTARWKTLSSIVQIETAMHAEPVAEELI